MARFQTVGRVEDFKEGLVRVFDVEGQPIAVVTHNGRFYAFTGHCPHANYSFNFTRVRDGDRILCSSHFAWFELETGRVLSGPVDKDLQHYEVSTEDGEVRVAVNDAT